MLRLTVRRLLYWLTTHNFWGLEPLFFDWQGSSVTVHELTAVSLPWNWEKLIILLYPLSKTFSWSVTKPKALENVIHKTHSRWGCSIYKRFEDQHVCVCGGTVGAIAFLTALLTYYFLLFCLFLYFKSILKKLNLFLFFYLSC